MYRLWIRPLKCYLICANARCGSTLLSRALSDTGIAGHPDEYYVTGPPEAFSPGARFWEDGMLAQRHGISQREDFLQLVYEVGSTPNGVFGATWMWNYVGWAVESFQELSRFSERRPRRSSQTCTGPAGRPHDSSGPTSTGHLMARAAEDGVGSYLTKSQLAQGVSPSTNRPSSLE